MSSFEKCDTYMEAADSGYEINPGSTMTNSSEPGTIHHKSRNNMEKQIEYIDNDINNFKDNEQSISMFGEISKTNNFKENEQCISVADEISKTNNFKENEQKISVRYEVSKSNCFRENEKSISIADDISKTVEMLLFEEQNQQEKAITSDSKYELKAALAAPDTFKSDTSKRQKASLPKTVETRLICEICGASISKTTGMKHHLRAHTDIRPYSCEVCTLTFKDTDSLRRHVKTHDPENVHLCDICGKIFSRREHLKNHKYLHTSSNPFTCQTCNKQFSRSDHLNRHLLLHTGEKKFSCTVCDRKFGKMYQLKEHMYTHGKEKPLKCESCDYACVRPSELKQHVERVHVLGCTKRAKSALRGNLEKTLTCEYCDFRFTKTLELKQHIECMHGLGDLKRTRVTLARDIIKLKEENLKLERQSNDFTKQTEVVKENEMDDSRAPSDVSSPIYLINGAVYQELPKQISSDAYAESIAPHPPRQCQLPAQYFRYSEGRNTKSQVAYQGITMGMGQSKFDYETYNAVRNMLSQETNFPDNQENWGQFIPNQFRFGYDNTMPVYNRMHEIQNVYSSSFETAASSFENENKVHLSINKHELEKNDDLGNVSDSTDGYDLSVNKETLEKRHDLDTVSDSIDSYDLSVNKETLEKRLDLDTVSDSTDSYDLSVDKETLEKRHDLDNVSDNTDSYDIECATAVDSNLNFGKADKDVTDAQFSFSDMSTGHITITTSSAIPKHDDIERNEGILNNTISIVINTNKGHNQSNQELKLSPEGEIKKHLCDICGKQYSKRGSLRHHKRSHSEDFSYVCGTCNKQFNEKGKLRRHVRTHDPNSNHLCDTCGKNFSRADHLKTHKFLHVTEKPHVCNICDKQFSRSDHLKRHLVSHSGERNFSCSICFKTFFQNYNLKEHMYTHGIEKPVHCTRCDRTFVRPSELKKHMLTHA